MHIYTQLKVWDTFFLKKSIIIKNKSSNITPVVSVTWSFKNNSDNTNVALKKHFLLSSMLKRIMLYNIFVETIFQDSLKMEKNNISFK